MNITTFIIDDSNNDIKTLSSILKSFQHDSNNISFHVKTFLDTEYEAMLLEIAVLYFIDIDMPAISGFDLARKIKANNNKAIIIFVSQHSDLVFESYRLETCYFIRKSNLIDDFGFAMDKTLSILEDKYSEYLYSSGASTQMIKYSDILYFEINYNDLFIHLSNGNVLKERKTMKKLSSEITSLNFIQTHYSFLVNALYIDNITEHFILLKAGNPLPITKSRYTSIKKEYLRYLGKR
ncbi:MAG: response regulator transcription factor [Anaerorhabdus sp.]|uniref:LytR/AlgR family response regulator transcription factor n=1 Tax=Anaerorhabdus sp. TaxID=1872524 RepID=UPI002FC61362